MNRTESELTLFQIDNPSNIFKRSITLSDKDEGSRKYEGVELANVKLSEQDKQAGRDDDLITLPHLHEPALLHACAERFFSGKIYTWTGPVLIAVNPFQRLPLYTMEILEQYRREGLLRSQGMGDGKSALGPHVYAIADRAYRQMMAEGRKSQSILISGESGAGKTESTKIVMLYLTTLGAPGMDSGQDHNNDLSTMERVLQSNPVLEAFGNARTLRNDNSSRFGKFIELGFSRAGHLLGAKVQTYLLEKVRLAFHASGERNYHIFYQLLRGASEEQKKHFEFHDGVTQGLELPNYFHYTGQGGAPLLREFTDEDGLKYTLKAMKALGWSQETIDTVLSLIAGILHLGQISFDVKETDGGVDAAFVSDESSMNFSARLLGVDTELFKAALTERVIVARGQEIRTPLTVDRAMDARDALSKTLYGALFLWVVDQVNQSVGWENDSDVRSSCGVLDIFGFECFAINSFEQLCINFTNEALQQQFNKFIFKLEQAEYEREQIEWAFIAFPDNQDCLDTIQMNRVGILAMLDDECRLPRGSDRNFANRMYEYFIPAQKQIESENTRFSATPVQKSKAIFCVRHFAGIVQYSAETHFMEKNKDEIPLTAQRLFETAPNKLVQDVYEVQKRDIEGRASEVKTGGAHAKSKTVGQQFKEQLTNLIESVEKTDPHYIRCLKPNDAAKPLMLTRKRLTEQLRYGGVLEAVRVARMGYPVRLTHSSFFRQYRMLLPAVPEEKLSWSIEGKDPQTMCIKLVDIILEEGAKVIAKISGRKLDPNEVGITRSEKIRRMQHQPNPIQFPKTDIQLGMTKVFLRKPPHDILESHRVFHQHAAATTIQCWIRGLEENRRFIYLQEAVLDVQRFFRGCMGRERWTLLRKAVAGNLLTNTFRMQVVRRRYQRAKKGSIIYQSIFRGYILRRVLAVIKIQKFIRMEKLHRAFVKLKTALLALQCVVRKRMATKIYEALRREQKDVGKLKQNNEKLKSEMASLKAMLQAQAQSAASGAQSSKDLEAKQVEINVLEKRIKELEIELEKQKALVKDLEGKMAKQKSQFQSEKQLLQQSHDHQMQLALQHHKRSSSNTSTSSPRLPGSPSPTMRVRKIDLVPEDAPVPPIIEMLSMPSEYVSPEVFQHHKDQVAKMEAELDAERKLRREADGEIIKLRATLNGVALNQSEIEALMAQKLESVPSKEFSADFSTDNDADEGDDQFESEDYQSSSQANGVPFPATQDKAPEVTGSEHEYNKYENQKSESEQVAELKEVAITPEVVAALKKLGISEAKDNHVFAEEKETEPDPEPEPAPSRRGFLLKSPSEYLPMIRRGFTRADEKEEEQVISVGWKVEVRSRKEREEMLRDDVDRFEIKMHRFANILEEGIDVTMWQLNRSADIGGEEKDDFGLKSTAVAVKLVRRGELFVQSVLTFNLRGGFMSKTLGRHRADKAALEPLSLYDILEVKAGCSGYDHVELPTGNAKGKNKKPQKENKQGNLFLTVKATPTPEASFRSYIFRFKSRSARNDVLNGLRSILADMQIREGVSISSIQQGGDEVEDDVTMVPLTEVHNAINKEREAYDRLLLLLLQGQEDLKDREDDLLALRGKLDAVDSESAEKDRIQANDSKLIMQLSKKLETLLMDNEDLRDQNDRLNSRLVVVECEKMNLLANA